MKAGNNPNKLKSEIRKITYLRTNIRKSPKNLKQFNQVVIIIRKIIDLE